MVETMQGFVVRVQAQRFLNWFFLVGAFDIASDCSLLFQILCML